MAVRSSCPFAHRSPKLVQCRTLKWLEIRLQSSHWNRKHFNKQYSIRRRPSCYPRGYLFQNFTLLAPPKCIRVWLIWFINTMRLKIQKYGCPLQAKNRTDKPVDELARTLLSFKRPTPPTAAAVGCGCYIMGCHCQCHFSSTMSGDCLPPDWLFHRYVISWSKAVYRRSLLCQKSRFSVSYNSILPAPIYA